jgi:hypothetical protein
MLSEEGMNKVRRCLLHSRCILRKRAAGRDWEWHWQHLLRELGAGVYSEVGRESVRRN